MSLSSTSIISSTDMNLVSGGKFFGFVFGITASTLTNSAHVACPRARACHTEATFPHMRTVLQTLATSDQPLKSLICRRSHSDCFILFMMFSYTHTHTHTHTYMHICIHIPTYICTYVLQPLGELQSHMTLSDSVVLSMISLFLSFSLSLSLSLVKRKFRNQT